MSIINRVINRANFFILKLRIQKHEALLRALGNLPAYEGQGLEFLKEQYSYYTKNISTPNMAASLELIIFISRLCRAMKFRKLLDMGSGFTSFCLRYHAKTDLLVKVWSVDDNEQWLEKTQQYLKRNELSTENLVTLQHFISSGEGGFDLLLLDLNFVEERKKYIQLAVERCSPGGIILFDDVHKREFLWEILQQTKNFPVKLYDLKAITLDEFGRYALLAIKH